MTPPIGIVGGGILGLTLAIRLAQLGHRVTVFEAAAAPGGLASPETIGPVTWDRFYHVILGTDRHLHALLEELGLADQIQRKPTRTGFFDRGRWISMTTPLDFLRFPLLSFIEKVRLAATIVWAPRIRDWRALENITAVSWLTKWSGRRAVDAVWRPLLRAKLGPNAERASAAFIWAILVRLYGARGNGARAEAMGYVQGGYARIIPALREFAVSLGVDIRAGSAVTRVRRNDQTTEVILSCGGSTEFSDVILTLPCPTVATVCPDLSAEERGRLLAVTYQGVICPSFLLKRPLKGYYVTNITDDGFPFTGVIEMTALVDPAELGGHHLVYLPQYVTPDDPLWQLGDDAVAARAFTGLQRMIPDLTADDVIARQVARAREVLAVSTLRYSKELMPPMRTSIPGVWVVNSAQIAQGTLNVDESVALADRATLVLRRALRERREVPVHV